MKKDSIFLRHILDSILAIENAVRDISRDDFIESRLIQSAVMREIEIVGEAVKNLSHQLRNKYKDIPWTKIAGMRDKLVHHYFGVDLDIVWDTIEQKIPELKNQIEVILKESEKTK